MPRFRHHVEQIGDFSGRLGSGPRHDDPEPTEAFGEILHLTPEELGIRIMKGEVRDSYTIAAVTMAQLHGLLAPLSIASDVADGIAPDVADGIAPDVADGIAPDDADIITPDIADVITPDVSDVSAPDLAEFVDDDQSSSIAL